MRSYDHYKVVLVRDGKEWTFWTTCQSSLPTSAAIAKIEAKYPSATVTEA